MRGFRAAMTKVKERRDVVFSLAKSVQQAVLHAQTQFYGGAPEATLRELFDKIVSLADKLDAELEGVSSDLSNASQVTDAKKMSFAFEAVLFFLSHGHLSRRRKDFRISNLTDQVFVLGIIEAARSLERYAVGRATCGDRSAVQICHKFVLDLQGKLIEFDFRNGPLRRSFDGVKYIHKKLVDLLYETSLCSNEVTKSDTPDEAAPGSLIPLDDLEAVRVRQVAYDLKRESVIKLCRDVQKLSKQAIFSLHRGNLKKCRSQLSTAAAKARDIYSQFLASEPSLRSGSYADAMEEWVEGRLFETWLVEKGRILSREELESGSPDLPSLKVTKEEYLGGIVDFTGEVGRWAVARATERNRKAVELALYADLQVESELVALDSVLPKRVAKKKSALANNAKKLEHVLYELSLLKGSGRRTLSAAKAEEPSDGDSDKNKRSKL